MENTILISRKKALNHFDRVVKTMKKYEHLHPYETAPLGEYSEALKRLKEFFSGNEIKHILKKIN